jgi:stringent starvation protein B
LNRRVPPVADLTSNQPYLIRALHEWINDNGLTPYLLVDAGQPGTRVPPQAVKDGRVVLNIAARAVTRLDLGNDVISFQARFNGVAMLVVVPIEAVLAIYAMENGQGMMFPPADQAEGAASPDPGPGDGAGAGAGDVDPDAAPDDPAPRPSHLRVVK